MAEQTTILIKISIMIRISSKVMTIKVSLTEEIEITDTDSTISNMRMSTTMSMELITALKERSRTIISSMKEVTTKDEDIRTMLLTIGTSMDLVIRIGMAITHLNITMQVMQQEALTRDRAKCC